MSDHPHTSLVSLTDARCDYLLTVADHLDHGVPIHPLVAIDAAAAIRDLVSQHHEKAVLAEFRRRRDEAADRHDMEIEASLWLGSQQEMDTDPQSRIAYLEALVDAMEEGRL